MPTVIVYWSGGRSQRQKERLIERITDAFIEEADAKQSDILIVFQNIEAGDAARAGQLLIPPPESREEKHDG